MTREHDYQNKVHNEIDTSCHPGEELHVITSNAFDGRMLNVRMHRIIPSKTGWTGYTKAGFFLNRQEARELRDALSDLVEDEDVWVVVEAEPLRDVDE